jgi:hypothetical protein
MFDKELDFFRRNQTSLLKQYQGKVLVIRENNIVGVYPTMIEAYKDATRKYELGTFMLQKCEPGPEAYTVTINSNGIANY